MKLLLRFSILCTVFLYVSVSGAKSYDGSPLSGQKHNRLDFNQQTLAYIQLISSQFENSAFNLSSFIGLQAKNIIFLKTSLKGLQVKNSSLKEVHFIDSDLSGLKCTRCKLEDVYFKNCTMDSALWVSSSFKRVRFENCDLSRWQIQGLDIQSLEIDKASAKGLTQEVLKTLRRTSP